MRSFSGNTRSITAFGDSLSFCNLLPTVTLQAAVQQGYEQALVIYRSFGASATAGAHPQR
jgi:hypothetical protein